MKKKIVAMITGACLCDRNICTGKCMGSTGDGRSIHAERKKPHPYKSIQCCKESVWDDYIPSEKVSKKELKERYGISSKWYSAAIAEVPMISANADTLVIVKAKNAASKKENPVGIKKIQGGTDTGYLSVPDEPVKDSGFQSLCKRKLCMLYHAWNNQQQAGGTVRGQSDCCI
mgnify:CR=1 FL=1